MDNVSNLIKFYSEKELKELYNLTSYHYGDIRDKRCGCFSCLKVFPSSSINEWTDDGETAKCPFCTLDTVLYQFDSEIEIGHNLLFQMNNRWMKEPDFTKLNKLK